MDIKQLKKELGLSNKDLSEFFDMSYGAYANSTAKERYEVALCRLYSHIKKASAEKIKEKKQIYTDQTNDNQT
jgi:hypothetical protein